MIRAPPRAAKCAFPKSAKLSPTLRLEVVRHSHAEALNVPRGAAGGGVAPSEHVVRLEPQIRVPEPVDAERHVLNQPAVETRVAQVQSVVTRADLPGTLAKERAVIALHPEGVFERFLPAAAER